MSDNQPQAEQTATMSDAYDDVARKLVSAADGPLRHTWFEHAAGATALLFQMGAKNLRTCGM